MVQSHNLTLIDRESLQATGVTFVTSFDDQEVVLETVQGPLCLKGEDLHITELSLEEGRVMVQGRLSVLEYKAPGKNARGKSKSFVDRLLK